jgi:phage terminase large subunit-like protein
VKLSFLEIANKYAREVVAGEVPACSYVRAACERHLRDLEAQESAEFPYILKPALVNRACGFLQLLPHIKGPKAGQLLKLEPWEVFLVGSIFGWVRKDNGKRRFRRVYTEVPRGNAKSTLSAGIGLYCVAADGEAGAEVYSAATTRDQARIVFEIAQEMARKSPGYRKKFGVKVLAHAITQPSSASIFRALSADADTLDGKNIHLAIVDELHAHPTRAVYDVLETGTGKRDQSLFWVITTAGTDQAGICFEVRSYVIKVLKGVISDDSIFGIIYTLDEGDDKAEPPVPGDDWADPATWVKANPNWNVSVMPEVVSQLAQKAIETPSAQNNFLTKHLNVWCNADVAWADIFKWKACADPALNEQDFQHGRCMAALDLASKVDIAALLKLFWKDLPAWDKESQKAIEGRTERHYYCFPSFYLPEATVRESKNSQYTGWVRSGYIIVTPGNIIDLDAIEEEIKAWPGRFEVAQVAYDPFQATQLSTHLTDDGFEMVEIKPTVLNFSEPMKELDALVRAGRFHHTGNPVLSWMMSNVVCHRDKKDNIYPNKERPENKIDGVVAIIMALSRAMIEPAECGEFKPFIV